MKTIKLQASASYEIKIVDGLLHQCGELTAEIKERCSAVLVSDDVVCKIYGDAVKTSYEEAGFSISSFIFQSGEASKNLGTVEKLLEFMAEQKITRSGLIIALGGGVVGDIAGFAAAIYLRGISYLQIPTTFLAAADSSVGGKTGINLKAGKNLTGSFNHPMAVFCDPETFKTLPKNVFNDGLCEVIKYGCISNRKLFDTLLYENIYYKLGDIIETSIIIKRDIVEQDEFDFNKRLMLNFGHTAGHAVEQLSNYTITHGRAVAIGMRIMANVAGNSGPLLELYNKYDIDSDCPFTAKELAENALLDKKRKGNRITLVLLEKLGKAYLETICIDELMDYFARGLRRSDGRKD